MFINDMMRQNSFGRTPCISIATKNLLFFKFKNCPLSRCKHVCITEIEEEQEEPALMPATRESNSMTTIESSEQKKAIQAKIAHYDMERKKLRVNGGSIHSTQTLNKTKQSRMNTSSVSFGVQSLIGLREVTDPSQLRNCKKRIPTPVVSKLISI